MFRQIIALTIKDLKVIFKDTGGVAALFLMPAMFIIVMSNALAGSFGGAAISSSTCWSSTSIAARPARP